MIRIKQDSKEMFCPLFYLSYIGIYRIVVNSWIFDSIKMDPGKWYIFTVNKIKFETLIGHLCGGMGPYPRSYNFKT